MTWFEIEEKHMMEAYIQRHKDERVMDTLEDVKKNAEYSCSDPRLHPRARKEVTRFTNIATERLNVIKKTLNLCISLSKIALQTIIVFPM